MPEISGSHGKRIIRVDTRAACPPDVLVIECTGRAVMLHRVEGTRGQPGRARPMATASRPGVAGREGCNRPGADRVGQNVHL